MDTHNFNKLKKKKYITTPQKFYASDTLISFSKKKSKPFLPELSTTNLLKKTLTAYYSLDKYFNKEITINKISTQVKKKHISNRGSIII